MTEFLLCSACGFQATPGNQEGDSCSSPAGVCAGKFVRIAADDLQQAQDLISGKLLAEETLVLVVRVLQSLEQGVKTNASAVAATFASVDRLVQWLMTTRPKTGDVDAYSNLGIFGPADLQPKSGEATGKGSHKHWLNPITHDPDDGQGWRWWDWWAIKEFFSKGDFEDILEMVGAGGKLYWAWVPQDPAPSGAVESKLKFWWNRPPDPADLKKARLEATTVEAPKAPRTLAMGHKALRNYAAACAMFRAVANCVEDIDTLSFKASGWIDLAGPFTCDFELWARGAAARVFERWCEAGKELLAMEAKADPRPGCGQLSQADALKPWAGAPTLGGYLERLAEDHPEHRELIVGAAREFLSLVDGYGQPNFGSVFTEAEGWMRKAGPLPHPAGDVRNFLEFNPRRVAVALFGRQQMSEDAGGNPFPKSLLGHRKSPADVEVERQAALANLDLAEKEGRLSPSDVTRVAYLLTSAEYQARRQVAVRQYIQRVLDSVTDVEKQSELLISAVNRGELLSDDLKLAREMQVSNIHVLRGIAESLLVGDWGLGILGKPDKLNFMLGLFAIALVARGLTGGSLIVAVGLLITYAFTWPGLALVFKHYGRGPKSLVTVVFIAVVEFYSVLGMALVGKGPFLGWIVALVSVLAVVFLVKPRMKALVTDRSVKADLIGIILVVIIAVTIAAICGIFGRLLSIESLIPGLELPEAPPQWSYW